MAVVGTIILWLLGILGVMLALILIMPISARASGSVAVWSADGEARGDWGLGLLGFRWSSQDGGWFRLFGFDLFHVDGGDDEEDDSEAARERRARRAARREARRARRAEKKREKEPRGARFWLRWLWENRPLFRRAVRALHLGGGLGGTVGTGDPADTAMLAALVETVVRPLPGDNRIAWDYVDEALYLEGDIELRVWPLELVWVALVTLLRGDSRRALLARY